MAPEGVPDVRAAQAALDRMRARWLGLPGVTAVDVGLSAGASPPGEVEVALRVHVEDRGAADRVAGQLPEEVDGFAVQVLEARYGLHDTGGDDPS